MHNGSVSDFPKLKHALCSHMGEESYTHIQGGTDSEHLAALYMTYLTQDYIGPDNGFEQTYSTQSMLHALRRTIFTVQELQQQLFGSAAQPNSLNLCTTDGSNMLAIRYRNSAVEQPPSLYFSTVASRVLNGRFPNSPNQGSRTGGGGDHGKHLIVASEPSTYVEGEWEVVGKNCWVGFDGNDRLVVSGRVEVESTPEGEKVTDWTKFVPPGNEDMKGGNGWVWDQKEGRYVCLRAEREAD
ncbi:hypothetical protein MBLNU230_g0634t1 [Neophaeotheca triangularis]